MGDVPLANFENLKSEELIKGQCTVEGTQRFKARANQTNSSKLCKLSHRFSSIEALQKALSYSTRAINSGSGNIYWGT